MNPRLESCVESYLEETFISDEEEITLSINNLKKIDLSILPTKVSSKIDDAHKASLTVFAKLSDVIESQKVLAEATKSYAKTHTEVRIIQREIRKIDSRIKKLKRENQITDDQNTKNHISDEIDKNLIKKKELSSTIPSDWEKTSTEYQKKLKSLTTTQRKYRRAMDDAHTGVKEAIITMSSGAGFADFQQYFDEFKGTLVGMSNEKKQEAIKAVSKNLNSIPGGSGVKSLLNKARKEFKKDNYAKANDYLEKANALLVEEIFWRKNAVKNILPILIGFQKDTAVNIGLRGQDRLPSFLVPRISRCRSVHQDISLYF
tara:strand:- start:66 stop:1016 length:951 start_codon:yes stop_codon:yes gene_type:complete